MNKKRFLYWFLGIWATSLGSRYALELQLADQFIVVPNYLVNIWFDFVPLSVMGLLVTIIEVRDEIIEMRL